MAKRNPLIRKVPKMTGRGTGGHKSAGILDDFAIRKNVATKEGTVEKVPVNDSDIVNKKYVDEAIAGEDLWDRAGTILSPKTAGDDITTTGNIGIGTSDPQSPLDVDVATDGGDTSIRIDNDAPSGSDDETTSLLFKTTGMNAGKISSKREGLYGASPARKSSLNFYTTTFETDILALKIDENQDFNFQSGDITTTGDITGDNIVGTTGRFGNIFIQNDAISNLTGNTIGFNAKRLSNADRLQVNNFIEFSSNQNQIIDQATKLEFKYGGTELISLRSQDVVINQDSNDVDFRVESALNTHALFVDAGNEAVGIFKSDPEAPLDVTGAIRSDDEITAVAGFVIDGNFRIKEATSLNYVLDFDVLDAETTTFKINAGATTMASFTASTVATVLGSNAGDTTLDGLQVLVNPKLEALGGIDVPSNSSDGAYLTLEAGGSGPGGRGGAVIWKRESSARYTFINISDQLVFDTTAQASTGDTGNAWIDFTNGACSFAGHALTISSAGNLTTTGTIKGANYQSGDGSAGITQSETGVTDFDIVIKDGLITSFTKN